MGEFNNDLLSEMFDDMGATVPSKPEVEMPDDSVKDLKQTDSIQEMNKDFAIKSVIYQSILAPELKKNEELKRNQKKTLMKISLQF